MSQSTENISTKESPKVTHDALKNLCENNAAYFANDNSEFGRRLHKAFNEIIEHINTINPMVIEVNSIVKYYDFDEETPGNGFRSFLVVVDASVSYGLQLCHKVCLKRDKIMFRKGTMTRYVLVFTSYNINPCQLCLFYCINTN